MLKAPSEILDKAKEQIVLRGLTALQVATELDLALQLVENFLNGEMVDRHTYDLVCEKLNIATNPFQDISPDLLDDKDVTSIQSTNNINDNTNNKEKSNLIESVDLARENPNFDDFDNLENNLNQKLVQTIRKNIRPTLIRQCDRLKIIDIDHPLNLHDLYIDLDVFRFLPSSRYVDLDETFTNIPPEQYDQTCLKKLQPPTIPANQILEKFRQILLTGSLGSGKTTLLKYWAITCIESKILPNYIPVFLPLRSLISDHNIANNDHQPKSWIKKQLSNYGWLNGLSAKVSEDQLLEQLLIKGKLLLLWDGFDEIPNIFQVEIANKILSLSDQYPQNQIVFATRNPVYSHILESFSISEIAPFQDSQINAFAKKWFHQTCEDHKIKYAKFQQLISINQRLAEVVSTPLFLTSLCTALNTCESIKSSFYQEILNLLLSKWEKTKSLTSDQPLKLSTSQKIDLLSYVAIVALDRHGYLWQNNQLVDDFQACLENSRSLSNLEINRDQLYDSLQWQHSLLVESAKGLYKLTHTSLHDYLAAYRLAHSDANSAQKYILDRIYFNRWHGVIVMTVSISQQSDRILKMMKKKIDELVSQDQHLQSFLTWVNQQSIQIQTPYKAVTIRALYLDIDLENTRSLDRARALDIAHSRSLERARTKAMGIDNTMATEIDIDQTVNLALNLDLALYFTNHSVLELACILEPELHRGLQFLLSKFPDPYKHRSTFATWWQSKGLEWSKKLRALIVQHRKSSQEWQFSENQMKTLRMYHDANKLLIECLNHAEYVSPLVKNQIESTLLLPQGEYSILQY
jgi:predicted NACHT family NTPase